MELIEAIQQRRSIRAFMDKPVPKDVIREILSIACRAPSAMNTQPWEFIVLSGEKLNRLRAAIVEKLRSGAPIVPDHLVVGWLDKSVYKQRQIAVARQLFQAMDIARDDKEKRAWWLERGFRFFDAPAAIIIATDKALGEAGPLLDIGAAMQNICLAALQFNLGTCIEDQGVLYPEVFREHAGIAKEKRFIIAIALGYPDPDFPANQIRSEREPAENLTTWVE
jgi:nitroreductase